MPVSPTESEPSDIEQPDTDQVTTADVVQSTDAPQDGNAANSSVADDKGAKEPQSGLEAVMAALDKTKAAEGKSPDPENGQEKSAGAASPEGKPEGEEELPEDPTPEEMGRLTSKTRRRVKMLLDQRDEWKGKAATFEQGHNSFQHIVTFARENELAPQELDAGFAIMAAMRKEPSKALEMLMPYVDSLKQVLGETLPPELQRQVDQGYITPELARQNARDRARAELASQQAETERQRRQADTERQTQERLGHDMATAASEYDRSWKQTDPDYALKYPLVLEKIEGAKLRGVVVKTPQDAVELVKTARAEVEAMIGKFRPKPTQIRPVTAPGASNSTRPAPKSSIEAIDQALAS